jgi:hypothetical protein
MQQYLVDVQLGGKPTHVQARKAVTIPEIAVLKAIHGQGSVTVTGKVKAGATTRSIEGDETPRTAIEERERLIHTYGSGVDVNAIFGGPLAPLPTTLRQIGVDPGAEAVRLREQAAQQAAAASALEEEDAAPDDADAEASIFDDED